jgi:hypothetical protein
LQIPTRLGPRLALITELAAEHRARTEELAQLKAATPGHIASGPDLLARVPQLPLALGALPEALQRSLYDAFQLQSATTGPATR